MPGVIRLQRGRGVRRRPGSMNGLEKEYDQHLWERKLLGEVAEYHFDAIKFRLAEKCFYEPDFLVMLSNGDIEIHEVKGFWEDDARVKIKVAAEKYPFTFIAVTKKPKKEGGGWEKEEF